MPYPKSPSRYPSNFFSLVSSLTQAPEQPITIRCATRSKAHNFRQHFNAFRRCCAEAGHSECLMLSSPEYSMLLNSKMTLTPSFPPKEERLHSHEPCIILFSSQDLNLGIEILFSAPTATEPGLPLNRTEDPGEDLMNKLYGDVVSGPTGTQGEEK